MRRVTRLPVRPVATALAWLCATAWLLTAAPAARAGLLTSQGSEVNLLTNGSFEASPIPNGNYCYLALYGNGCGTIFSSDFGWGGSAPVISAFSSAWGLPAELGNFSGGGQVVGVQSTTALTQHLALAPGRYTLNWSDAGRAGYAAAHYEVLFGGALLGSFNTQPGEAWALNTLDFSASGAGDLVFRNTVRQYSLATDGTAFIDGLVLRPSQTQVPEPGSVSLAGVALGAAAVMGGLAASRRRRL